MLDHSISEKVLLLRDAAIQQEFIFSLADLIQTSCVYCATAAAFGPRRVTMKNKWDTLFLSILYKCQGLTRGRFTDSLHPSLILWIIWYCLSPFPLCERAVTEKSFFYKILVLHREMFWCPSCQEQGIVGWPFSSTFREQRNVGAQSFEKGALNHRNSWPKSTNFLLSSINKLHCLEWERANDHVVLHIMTFLEQPGPLGELKKQKIRQTIGNIYIQASTY